jgi:hypothetical protein
MEEKINLVLENQLVLHTTLITSMQGNEEQKERDLNRDIEVNPKT